MSDFPKTWKCGHNIQKLVDVLTNFSFVASDTELVCSKNGLFVLMKNCQLSNDLTLYQEYLKTINNYSFVPSSPLKTKISFKAHSQV